MAGSNPYGAYQGTAFEKQTYGNGEWNTALNNPAEKSSNDSGSSSTETVIGVSEQVFRCTCWGLKPNTLHKAFLLTKDVSIDCAPITANVSSNSTYTYGSSLISTAEGKLTFDYAFKPQNSPYPTKQVASTGKYIAIVPFGKQTFKVSSLDGSSVVQSFIESKQST